MNTKVMNGIAVFTVSSAASTYIIAKTCSSDARNTALTVLTIATLVLAAVHIASSAMFKSNILWTASKAVIIPEVIITCILFIWKPAAAFLEITLVILFAVFSCLSILRKASKTNLHSKIFKCINVNLLSASIILIPGLFIIMPYISNSKPLISISSHDVSQSESYCTAPNHCKLTAASQKERFIKEFIETHAAELNMVTVPNVEICYLPGPLYGSYSRDSDLIIINASIVQEDNIRQLVNTASHELFHRYEHMLTEDYANGLLSSDTLSDDIIERIKSYSHDFQSYASAGITEGSYSEYYNQPCEIDARAYAEQTADNYFNT